MPSPSTMEGLGVFQAEVEDSITTSIQGPQALKTIRWLV